MSSAGPGIDRSLPVSLLAYKLLQNGPSFPEASDVSFDRARGRYRARTGTDAPAEGTLDLPGDVHNGMPGTLLRNLPAAKASPVAVDDAPGR